MGSRAPSGQAADAPLRGGSLGVWPPLAPSSVVRRRGGELPFPLGGSRTLVTSTGRQGLYLGLRELGVGAGHEVLMPAYHHGSEVEAVRRTGAACAFYEGTGNLEPDPEELDRLRSERTRALHLTHFIGFPQDAGRWRRWCDERGLLLIEDAAQGWLGSSNGKPLGSHGDVSVFCLYKTVGVPDGAATAVCAERLPAVDGEQERALLAGLRLAALWAAQRAPLPRRRRGDAEDFDAEAEFDLGTPGRPASRLTMALLPRFDFGRAARLRRANYSRLLDAIGERVPTPFDQLPEGAVPWFFPIRSREKRAMLDHLSDAGIRALDFWSVGHPSLPEGFSKTAERRATTIGLPVHQELSAGHVDRIARAASAGPR